MVLKKVTVTTVLEEHLQNVMLKARTKKTQHLAGELGRENQTRKSGEDKAEEENWGEKGRGEEEGREKKRRRIGERKTKGKIRGKESRGESGG